MEAEQQRTNIIAIICLTFFLITCLVAGVECNRQDQEFTKIMSDKGFEYHKSGWYKVTK